MTDTAKLTIKVDSTSANKATAELDKLTASSARAEAATESLGETDKQRTKRIRDMVQASLGQ